MSASEALPMLYRTSIEAMGCLFECFIPGDDAEAALAIGREALDEVVRLDAQLSHYRADSDIGRLNRYAASEWVRVEPLLFRLLQRCSALTRETEGAFDISVGALLKAWDFHHGAGRIASEAEVSAALAQSRMHRVLLNPDEYLVHFDAPGLTLNLGAIGKGYAIDRAAETLRFYGPSQGVIDGGRSTILALGNAPSGEPWEFVIRDPRDRKTPIETVRLRDAALSTSGSYDQFVEADGVKYGHVLDPRTGYPVQGLLSVSVIASNATDADALSTALFVMGTDGALDFCRTRPDISAIILEERPLESRHDACATAVVPPLRVTRIGLP